MYELIGGQIYIKLTWTAAVRRLLACKSGDLDTAGITRHLLGRMRLERHRVMLKEAHPNLSEEMIGGLLRTQRFVSSPKYRPALVALPNTIEVPIKIVAGADPSITLNHTFRMSTGIGSELFVELTAENMCVLATYIAESAGALAALTQSDHEQPSPKRARRSLTPD